VVVLLDHHPGTDPAPDGEADTVGSLLLREGMTVVLLAEPSAGRRVLVMAGEAAAALDDSDSEEVR
jgi:hypothetical protein